MLLGGSPGYAKQKSPCVIRLINFWLYRYIYILRVIEWDPFWGEWNNTSVWSFWGISRFSNALFELFFGWYYNDPCFPVHPDFIRLTFDITRFPGLKLAKCLISKVLFSTLLCSNNMIREAYRFNMRCQKKLVGCFPHQKKRVGRLWWAFTTGSLSDPELLREMLNQQRRRSKNSTREWLNPF